MLTRKAATQIGDSVGDENLAIMADPSNPSNISSHEELLEEYRRECNRADERLLLSYYRKIEEGIIKIKEWTPPSTIDLLKEVQSSGTLSDALFEIVRYLIDQCWGNGPAHIAKWTDCKGQGIKM